MLVQLLLAERSLVGRAREAVPATEFRHPGYRQVAEALYAGAAGPVSPEGQAVWMDLAARPLGDLDVEREFAACLTWMQDRRATERRAEIDRLIEVAPADEKPRLLAEKTRLTAGGERRYGPKAFKSRREPKH
jgi:hypothetical protein